jgi:two-component system CheB/CheR fusion protein
VDPSEIERPVAGFEVGSVPQLLIDVHGVLCAANVPARELLGVEDHHIGRAIDDPGLPPGLVEVRSRIERVLADPATVEPVELTPESEVQAFDIIAARLPSSEDGFAGTSVSFIEVPIGGDERAYSARTRAELDAAYEDVASTVEQLESTNEELQSTLGALAATNAALDTMNRQLESTNDELETMHEELRQRTDRLNELNSFLDSILARVQSGVIVVDRDMRVQVWNQHAVELWGLRADEVEGAHLASLDIGLPVEHLNEPIRSCLNSEEVGEFELDAIDRRGRAIRIRTVVAPLCGSDSQVVGAILIVDAR